MQVKQKQLNMLGLAKKASQLVSGDELVEKAIKNHQVKLVICASDASQATLSRYQRLCQTHQIPLFTEFNRDEISGAIGSRRTICAIRNDGMVKTFLSYS